MYFDSAFDVYIQLSVRYFEAIADYKPKTQHVLISNFSVLLIYKGDCRKINFLKINLTFVRICAIEKMVVIFILGLICAHCIIQGLQINATYSTFYSRQHYTM